MALALWRPALALVVLVFVSAFAGCVDDPEPAQKQDGDEEIPEGLGLVEIWVKRPIDADRFPIHSITGIPYRIGFSAGDNDTRAKLGFGIWAFAEGWPDDYNVSANDGKHPKSAEKNWMSEMALWYRGHVPAGNYSTIRVELHDILGEMHNGAEANITALGDRLSFGPGEGEVFAVKSGEKLPLVFDCIIKPIGEYQFLVQ